MSDLGQVSAGVDKRRAVVADGERHTNKKFEDGEGQKDWGVDNLVGRELASRMAECDKIKTFLRTLEKR